MYFGFVKSYFVYLNALYTLYEQKILLKIKHTGIKKTASLGMVSAL